MTGSTRAPSRTRHKSLESRMHENVHVRFGGRLPGKGPGSSSMNTGPRRAAHPYAYGFRPGRSCHDAIEAIFKTLCGTRSQRRWILDADLAGAFDSIAHEPLLAMIGAFPARGMIREWLKAGVIESGRFTPTGEGTPQGGVISPCLLNVALHGMERAAGV